MLKRLFLALLLFAAAGRAAAIDFTDIWFLAAESGWGVNVVQSDNFLFVTFFIYGADGTPTWYTAQLTLDASGNYNGPLLRNDRYVLSDALGAGQPSPYARSAPLPSSRSMRRTPSSSTSSTAWAP